jgi:hypothetical protein
MQPKLKPCSPKAKASKKLTPTFNQGNTMPNKTIDNIIYILGFIAVIVVWMTA